MEDTRIRRYGKLRYREWEIQEVVDIESKRYREWKTQGVGNTGGRSTWSEKQRE